MLTDLLHIFFLPPATGTLSLKLQSLLIFLYSTMFVAIRPSTIKVLNCDSIYCIAVRRGLVVRVSKDRFAMHLAEIKPVYPFFWDLFSIPFFSLPIVRHSTIFPLLFGILPTSIHGYASLTGSSQLVCYHSISAILLLFPRSEKMPYFIRYLLPSPLS